MDGGGQQSSIGMENVPAGWKPTPARSRQGARESKKRGPDRQELTIVCKKKQEKSLKRKMKRKMKIGRGKAVCPPKRYGKGSNVENEAPISVMCVDNTAGGQLVKRLQAEELRMGRMTGYRVRIAEYGGMPLSRLLPSTNPWRAGDCGRDDCVLFSQEEDKRQNCKMWNVLYENKCTVCNVEVKNGKKRQPVLLDGHGIYIG